MKISINVNTSEINAVNERAALLLDMAGLPEEANETIERGIESLKAKESETLTEKYGTFVFTKTSDEVDITVMFDPEFVCDMVSASSRVAAMIMPTVMTIYNGIKNFGGAMSGIGEKLKAIYAPIKKKWAEDESEEKAGTDTDGIKIKGSVSGEVFIKSAKEYEERHIEGITKMINKEAEKKEEPVKVAKKQPKYGIVVINTTGNLKHGGKDNRIFSVHVVEKFQGEVTSKCKRDNYMDSDVLLYQDVEDEAFIRAIGSGKIEWLTDSFNEAKLAMYTRFSDMVMIANKEKDEKETADLGVKKADSDKKSEKKSGKKDGFKVDVTVE